MADLYTPNLNLTLPEVGSSRDTWGAKLNQNFSTLDSLLYAAMPIGAILDFGGAQAPAGWLICDGRLISRVTYAALFAAIGTAWGAGDGATTFALPPTPGRAMIGPGIVTDSNGTQQAFSFAQRTGALSQAIAQANLPNYQLYCDAQGYHAHGGQVASTGPHGHAMDGQGDHNHGGWTDAQGGHDHGGATVVGGNHQHQSPWISVAGIPGSGGGPGSSVAPTFGPWTSQAGDHIHGINWAGSHQHAVGTYNAGLHAHNTWGGDHVHTINPDGSHAHNVWLGGSGAALSLLTPVMVVTKIIYAGGQAMTQLHALAAPAQMGRLSAPMRGAH